MTDRPTFLFTDIEASTRLWDRDPDGMRASLARHDALVRRVVAEHGGTIFKSAGDGWYATLPDPRAAVLAAVAIQRAVRRESWEVGELRVRIAIHAGPAEFRDGEYYGGAVNRLARILAAAHGGQVLLSAAAAEAVRGQLPEPIGLRSLGTFRLRDLTEPEPLFQIVHPELPAEFPTLRAFAALAHNLPAPVSSFVGREAEREAVRAALASARLLTLLGPGGIGKTRLAIAVAETLVDDYPDGVWMVELAPLADPALVPQSIAMALGVREEPGRPLLSALGDALCYRRLLLVLDNCEHVIDACARVAQELLARAPRLQILCTSREALRVPGETLYPVPSLSTPAGEEEPGGPEWTRYEAIRLFEERARGVRPGFRVTAENAAAVAELCRRLDGLPLAIELAAARVNVLSPEQLARRLHRRFELLTARSRAPDPRQQTLRGAIDWSYELLTEAERVLFRRAGVFAGSFDLPALEAVGAGGAIGADDVLPLAEALVGRSLLAAEEVDGETRYRMLETLRAYAAERLAEVGEEAECRRQHALFYADLALAQGKVLEEERGEEYARAMKRLDLELDNLRAALAWALRHDGTEALKLTRGLGLYWLHRGLWSEAREAIERALEIGAEGPAELRARALRRGAVFANNQGDYEAARRFAEAGLALCRELGDTLGAAVSLLTLGEIANNTGDAERAQACYGEALEHFIAIGRLAGIGNAHRAIGALLVARGDLTGAEEHFRRCLQVYRQAEQPTGIAIALRWLGDLARLRGERERARECFEECDRVLGEFGDRGTCALLQWSRGMEAADRGDRERARRFLDRGLAIAREIGARDMAALIAGDRALVDALEGGDIAEARSRAAEAIRTLRVFGSRHHLARALAVEARLAMLQGDADAARAALAESLELRRQYGERIGYPATLESCARYARLLARWEAAARLLGAAGALRRAMDTPAPPVEERELAELTEAVRAALGAERAEALLSKGASLVPDAIFEEARRLLAPPEAASAGT